VTASDHRTVKLEYLSRVEGEGGLFLRFENDAVVEAKLNIFEPPRFFEAFLRRRHFQEVPDITARICGICPVAYQMSSVHAIERALGVVVDPAIRMLRRLLYWGEWIESHALHIYLLHAPDFLGYDSGISMAKDYRAEVERGLHLKKIGNDLLELLGGRAIHPVSVCVGGFYKVPSRRDLLAFRGSLEKALDESLETVRWVSGFFFPDFAPECEFVSLSSPSEYALNEGRLVSSQGLDVDVCEFEHVFLEEHVPHSTALHSVRAKGGTSYCVGPLARLNLNADRLLARAKEAANSLGVPWPWRNPYFSIAARAVEMVQACEEALILIEAYREPQRSRVNVEPQESYGCAATEAPRGTLFHGYRLNAEGLIESARIVPPTAQNLRTMEQDLKLRLRHSVHQCDEEIIATSENLVRSFDPCISCSTHFLKITIHRD
jgi:coenzyme F420-reducing hydrogenase alpha subunit